ncbi:MAG: multiheme c-type cytochrome, partial [Phycisphaerae bacterium]
VDAGGFLMTDGVEGVNTQWNLDLPANGTVAGFAAYLPDQQTPLPYAYDCFRCHTTGPQAQDPANPRSQDGRPGILGTWAEPGVQCEACHGPGSNHVPNPQARALFVDSTSQTCARCHTAGDDPKVIVAAGGYVNPNTQYAELLASGGHASFDCTICHDPHASTVYDRANGIRNQCTACHTDANMARHEGRVFTRSGYVETLTCESCHMSFAGKSGAAATQEIVGAAGRMGDTRSHIFRIDTRNANFNAMFSNGGGRVVTDGQGRAAVTVDFVCLRCHADESAVDNSAFPLSLDFASQIASRIHDVLP